MLKVTAEMSDYIQKKLKKLKATDDDVVKWANVNGYGNLLPGNIALVKQIYVDEHDDEELEFPDLEMRGERVLVREIPSEKWVIIRVFMFKIVRTTSYPMCPEKGCYSRVKESYCQAPEDKSHGYVAEAAKGLRDYYLAGDGGTDGERVYVIVPAKYAMNGYNFEKQWCDVKGIWNAQLEGFFASAILPIGKEELERGGIATPVSELVRDDDEEIAEIPRGLDLSAFAEKPTEKVEKVSVDESTARFRSELAQFQQIIPFFNGYYLHQFNEFITGNDITTPLKKLIEETPGCRIEGEGSDAKVFYTKP